MHKSTQQGFSIEKLDVICSNNHFDHNEFGIGKLLDNQIRNSRAKSKSSLLLMVKESEQLKIN